MNSVTPAEACKMLHCYLRCRLIACITGHGLLQSRARHLCKSKDWAKVDFHWSLPACITPCCMQLHVHPGQTVEGGGQKRLRLARHRSMCHH